MTQDALIRIRLKIEQFQRYKVYCAINNITMTDQTNALIRKFLEEQNEKIKIINIEKKIGDK